MENAILLGLWNMIVMAILHPLFWPVEHFPALLYLPVIITVLVFLVTMWGLVRKKKSCWIGFLAAWLALLSLIGSAYAWVESASLYFTVLYLLISFLSIVSCIRQCSACSIVVWLKDKVKR
ncbi:hypothetical protein [Kistimonas scapharcae]|uniref:hypothetical protein n=1 Tax=Kistimonas scapharcae TaxID=1036133 RepID=UPI0031E5BB76